MHRLRMQTENKADTNYRKLAELFPNAVTIVAQLSRQKSKIFIMN